MQEIQSWMFVERSECIAQIIFAMNIVIHSFGCEIPSEQLVKKQQNKTKYWPASEK